MDTKRQRKDGLDMQGLLKISLVTVVICLYSVSCTSTQTISPTIGIDRLANPYANWPIIIPGVESRSFSSFDRTGGGDDGFLGTYSYLYRQGNEYVIYDDIGPGCLNSLWFTGVWNVTIKYYFDNDTSPRITITSNNLFVGQKTKPFISPLVFHHFQSTGGFVSCVPFLYAKRLKITTSDLPQFYSAQYDRYPMNTRLQTYNQSNPNTGYDQMRFLWNQVLNLQTITAPDSSQKVPLSYTYQGSGVISELWFKSSAAVTKDALNNALIKIWWDGEDSASVNCPMGSLFGSGQGESKVTSVAFGMNNGLYVCRFPMPFWKGFRIEVSAIAGTFWLVRKANNFSQDNAGYFHAYYAQNKPVVAGKDFEFLTIAGTGKVVGELLNVDPHLNSTLDWWEGDFRNYTEGKREPNMHGTGHEDDYMGGWHPKWEHDPYSLPMHGLPLSIPNIGGAGDQWHISAYRLYSGVTFLDSVSLSVEHGNEDSVMNVDYSGTTYFYVMGRKNGFQKTDTFDPCDSVSLIAHQTVANNLSIVVKKTSAFTGRDYQDNVTFKCRNHGNLSFKATVLPQSQGVYLRKVFDQTFGRQLADVAVNGKLVGQWYIAERNDKLCWAERDFYIPFEFIQGKSQISVTITPDTSNAPWNVSSYTFFSYIPTQAKPNPVGMTP